MFNHTKTTFEGIGELWIRCLSDIMEHGIWIKDNNEKLLEITNYYVEIKDVDESDMIIDRFADKGRIAFLQEKYISKKILADYKVSYGQAIYDNNGVNQIDWVLQRLKNKIECKSATISLHTPGNEHLACLSLLDFKVREGKLIMNVIYRSQNIFASQVGNLIALHRVQQKMAGQLNVMCGSIELMIMSAHIYDYDIKTVRKLVSDYHKMFL